MQLHHRTYDCVRRETDDDLVAVCDRCHLLIHQDEWDQDTHVLLRTRFLRLGETQFNKLLRQTTIKAVREEAVREEGSRRTRTRLTTRIVHQWYACSQCSALPGEKCWGDSKRRKRPHLARWEYAESERLRNR